MLVHGSVADCGLSRVVVLGASGFIGRRLVQVLGRVQTRCLPISRRDIDLTASDSAERLQRVFLSGDSVVMLSALTPEKGRDRATFLKNVVMVDNLCAAISDKDLAHLVYVSSDSVYNWNSEYIDETSCCESTDLYALSHIVREKLLVDICAGANLDLVIVRPAAVYGAGDSHGSYGPNRFLRSSLTEGKITLFGQGEEQRDHIFVDDLCRLLHLCLLHRSSGVVNAATGISLSFAEIAMRVVEAVGRDIFIDNLPRAMPIRHRFFDTAALKNAFPQFQMIPFGAGIRATLQTLTTNAVQCSEAKERDVFDER